MQKPINANVLCITHFRVTFKTTANQAVVDRLVREVKGLNTEFLSQHITGKGSKKIVLSVWYG